MKPGERFEAIMTTSELLMERNLTWGMLDMLFDQFGFNTWSRDWEVHDGDMRDYAIAVLSNKHAPDDALPELHEYLTEAPAASTSLAGAAPWKGTGLRLFLSHSTDDKVLVSEVRDLLALEGVEAFVAHEDIKIGSDWANVIEAALQTCDALAAFLTNPFLQSRWTDQEVGYAFARKVPLFGIRLPHDPAGFMGRYQGLAISDAREAKDIAAALVRGLLEHETTAPIMADACKTLPSPGPRTDPAAEQTTRDLVTQFTLSSSFMDAERNWRAIQQAPAWTTELLDLVLRAEETNSQIQGAWKIPDGVIKLFVDNERGKLAHPTSAATAHAVPSPDFVPVQVAALADDGIPF